ncbi:transporter substrate-binding domain-containing protein [Marinobacter apostichopi]|uniref:transporter substrate-binding domain-containing protein n=1 Tax=Marinobacter apostichopi TaxID=3035454 RepID=UPI0025734011|nr:transporter substrate-binding domain-containing protein [Marinobacter sp. LA51]
MVLARPANRKMKAPRMSVLLMALMAFSGSGLGADIRIGIGQEFASVIAPESGQLKGEISRAYNCMINNSGYSAQFVVLPLARLINELRVGNVDVGLPLVHDPSRDGFATFGDAVLGSSYLRVSLPANSAQPEGRDVRYAYIRGFAGKTMLKDLEGPIFAVSEWGQALEMLRRQRVDYVLITEKTFGAMTADSDEPFVVEKMRDLNVAFYVSNHAPELLHAMNAANARCRS